MTPSPENILLQHLAEDGVDRIAAIGKDTADAPPLPFWLAGKDDAEGADTKTAVTREGALQRFDITVFGLQSPESQPQTPAWFRGLSAHKGQHPVG